MDWRFIIVAGETSLHGKSEMSEVVGVGVDSWRWTW